MSLRLEARQRPSRLMQVAVPVLSAVLTIIGGSALFAILGQPPVHAFYTFFVAPISDLYGLGELCLKAAPILLCALGLAAGFRANVWNIGAEGQLVIGAIGASALALRFGDAGGSWLLPVMFAAGALGGMAWAAIAAWLRTRFNASEILVTLMLNYVAGLFLSYLVYGPLRSPTGFNWPESSAFADSARLPRLLAGTHLNLGFAIAVAAVAAFWFFLARSHLAYRMEVGGLAPRAAAYAGFSKNQSIWATLLIGGAAAGLAGTVEVAGTIGKLREVVSPGYGYAAIIVAFIGRLHPLGILLASLLMALFYLGGEQAKVTLGVPSAITGIFQGMLLFFLLMCDLLIAYRLRWVAAPPVSAPTCDDDA